MPTKLSRVFLVINLAVYWGYAAASFIVPHQLAGQLDIVLGSASALADFRAMYGGLSLSVGWVFWQGLRKEEWLAQAVTLATVGAAALALGRVLTLLVDGMPAPLILGLLATELGAVIAGVWLLSRGAAVSVAPPITGTGS